ncbi:type II secretion system protein GspM [Solemya velum gill symbiont]|uniref:Type II protein secretion system GspDSCFGHIJKLMEO, subunit M n=1 Tax=Solemya velum gill symbiont TaxID=2340 RepID=A0A0B0H690_SOVGS|nr:type II secretion system protein GspM [Solemya velum gill symbiont]KHF25723.1 type II protein secretion system GspDSCFGHIJKLMEO, subunit M [Solemya velum gill symbiont]OOY35679.1 hypothetical protein BOV88_03285 [Solemya velum gill symbiont]OOY38307.1 hypothetical protein BOV89_02550 [Solemya velum gill symbiont]OOY40776.1 hypothetical protein BOV90_02305 [Solemya velum gill symbiont]OOY43535.1 hypothetical protein BOV92_10990 [Solemya velum gill symbiont]
MNIREWFAQRTQQEQLLITIASVFLILFLFYLLLLRPQAQHKSELQANIDSRTSMVNWMAGASAEIRALQAGHGNRNRNDGRTLIARVSSVLKEKSIVPSGMQPEGQKRLRVTIDSVAFTVLMERLGKLYGDYGVSVEQATIRPVDGATGIVSARLTLSRP